MVASPVGLKSIDLYMDQDLKAYTHDVAYMKTYVDALDAYFKGGGFNPKLPLDLHGTPFDIRTWNALLTVPYGETRSYKDIAEMILQPKAYRAVGHAVGRNPLLIVIPCHRIIKSDGSIGGFSSDIFLKIELLKNESDYLNEKTI